MGIREGSIRVRPMGTEYGVTITPLGYSGPVAIQKVDSLPALRQLLQDNLAHVDDIDQVIETVKRGEADTILRVALRVDR
jgi:hypothetical protein